MATTDMMAAIAIQLKELWAVYLVVAIVGVVGTYFYWDNESKLKKFGPDILVRKKAYYNRKTIARLTDKGGRECEFIIKQDTEYPGTIEKKEETNKATLREPSIVSARARGTLSNGIPIYNFFVGFDFPISYRTATAITELMTHIRQDHPELNWLGDVGIIQGIFNSTEYAYEDCVNLVQQYVELGAEIPDEFFQNPEPEDEDDDDDDDTNDVLQMSDIMDFDETDEEDMQ